MESIGREAKSQGLLTVWAFDAAASISLGEGDTSRFACCVGLGGTRLGTATACGEMEARRTTGNGDYTGPHMYNIPAERFRSSVQMC